MQDSETNHPLPRLLYVSKLEKPVNEASLFEDLNESWEVLAEPIQTASAAWCSGCYVSANSISEPTTSWLYTRHKDRDESSIEPQSCWSRRLFNWNSWYT